MAPPPVAVAVASHRPREPRHRRKQRLRVFVLRPREHLFGGAGLDDPARTHHRDVVREVFDDAKVVRDEEVRDAELALQPRTQVESLRRRRM